MLKEERHISGGGRCCGCSAVGVDGVGSCFTAPVKDEMGNPSSDKAL